MGFNSGFKGLNMEGRHLIMKKDQTGLRYHERMTVVLKKEKQITVSEIS